MYDMQAVMFYQEIWQHAYSHGLIPLNKLAELRRLSIKLEIITYYTRHVLRL